VGSTAAVCRERNRGWALLKSSGAVSVLSARGDEAPGDSGAVVTDLSAQSVRQGVDGDRGCDQQRFDGSRGSFYRVPMSRTSGPFSLTTATTLDAIRGAVQLCRGLGLV
jgi:hypothetical protein